MPLPIPCIVGNEVGGAGGVAGGMGQMGQNSQKTSGQGATSYAPPMLETTTSMKTTWDLQLFKFYDDNTPADLSNYSKITLTAKERADLVSPYFTVDVTIVDAPTGQIRVELPAAKLPYAGIWKAAFTCYDLSTPAEVIAEYPCTVVVNKGILHKLSCNTPITIQELRLAMRDFSPEFNSLLFDLEFSDAEIAFAIQRPIDEWNEMPPTIRRYTTATFPYRDYWRIAIMSHLCISSRHHYARNAIEYSAGGMTVRDEAGKFQSYSKIAQDFRSEWLDFVTRTKREINANACFRSGGIGIYG